MSEQDEKETKKKPRATYSPLILLALGIGAYAYYNTKHNGPETIPDLRLTPSSAQAQTLEPAASGDVAEADAEKTAEPQQDAAQDAQAPEEQSPEATETAQDEEPAAEAKDSAATLESMIKPRTLGSPDAPLKIVEHASFTCPHCAHFHADSFKKLVADYVDTGKVQMIFVDFPFNRPAVDATMISRCVPERNYFNFVRLLFETQKDWTAAEDYRKLLKQHAMIAGLSAESFDACINNEALQKGILEYVQASVKDKNITSVPTLVLNDKEIISGNIPYEEMKKVIDAALEAASGGKQQ